MRVLVLSDIHDKIENVRVLREKEDNVYDTIIVAGDMGSKNAKEFYSILDSFECPSFCVFGNWDNKEDYMISLSTQCTLLHHNIIKINDFYITGFSGCPAHWGKNPIYLEEERKLLERHAPILVHLESERARVEEQSEKINTDYEAELARLSARTKDRRRISIRRAAAKLGERRLKRLQREWRRLEKIRSSRDYKSYRNDRSAISRFALFKNREILFEKLRNDNIPDERLIIVTHERMYKIFEEGVCPLLHIYGHVHKYTFNLFKGTYYLNAAAIDNGLSEFFGRREILPEGYCDVVIAGGEVSVTRKLLFEGGPADFRE